jgi:aryl-alcohol dehydrogenase-like predicted oxidoreductase
VLARGKNIVPTPGTTRRSHLEENVAALEIVLTRNDMMRIEAAAPKGAAAGMRYSEEGMKTVNG